MMVVLIHPNDFLLEGLCAVHVDATTQARRSHASNVDQFKSIFGKHPKHLARVWRDLQTHGIMNVEDRGLEKSFKGFLLANNYLKLYLSLNVQGALFTMPHNLMKEL